MLRPNAPLRRDTDATFTRFLAALYLALAASACGQDADSSAEYTGPLMRPGEDCLSCHSEGAGRGAPIWSLGGTVSGHADAAADEGIAGVDVVISDAAGGLLLKLTTNAVATSTLRSRCRQNFASGSSTRARASRCRARRPPGSAMPVTTIRPSDKLLGASTSRRASLPVVRRSTAKTSEASPRVRRNLGSGLARADRGTTRDDLV